MAVKRLWRGVGGGIAGVALAWLVVCAWLSFTHPRVSFTAAELNRPDAPLPDAFLWGTANSAHQSEGGNRNDWTRFESEPGHIDRGETSAVAADGWNRLFADIALMKAIHANAYRFSIEWSRLEPVEGAWDEAAWSRYAEFTKALRAQGITPMVTLLHFTLPLWMADRGGVTAADFPERFSRFAAEAGKRLGPDVDLWVTLNEPNVQMYLGYLLGRWPPLKKSEPDVFAAEKGLLRAHAAAAKALRVADPACSIGIANNVMWLEPRSRLLVGDWLAAGYVDQFWNWSFSDSLRSGRARLWLRGKSFDEPMPELAGTTDFFGLNYYVRYFVHLSPGAPEMVTLEPGPGLRSDLPSDPPIGDTPPEALLLLMREAWKRYRQPIYITEGGIADERGTLRGPLLRGQAEAIRRALAEDIPVKGYLHWSLYDNFEWDKGYRPRFGLFRVDRQTFERTPAAGADVFSALAPRQ